VGTYTKAGYRYLKGIGKMNILIIKMSSMGDIIHTLPALTDAKKAFPQISFDWVIEENFAEIPKWHPAVKNVLPISIRRWRHSIINSLKSGEIRWFLKNLRSKSYDYVIDAQGLMKSAAVTLFTHGIHCGYDKHSVRESLASIAYQKKFSVPKKMHAIMRNRKLFAAALGYSNLADIPEYGIDTNLLQVENIPENGDYLIFIHGTSKKEKFWPEHHWLELAQLATNRGFKIKLPWSTTEELQRAKNIAANNNNIEVLPKLNLSSLAYIMLKAKGVVAIDTGLGHLATALNTPTISLYGPTEPSLIGALGANQLHMTNFTKVTAADVLQKIIENFR
jgi:heptosyltransferase-1